MLSRIDRYQNVKKGWREFSGGRKYYLKSLWEINYAYYLEWLLLNGHIKRWEYEPRTFWFPVKRGTTNYKPDFRVVENDGHEVWYEVKGYMDSRSATALKRMRLYHPEIDLRLVDRDCYEDILRKAGRMFGAEEA